MPPRDRPPGVLAVIGASNVSDWALLLAAISGFLLASTVLIVVLRQTWKRIDAKFGGAEVTIEAKEALQATAENVDKVLAQVTEINKAVNSVPKGTAPMVQRVAALEIGHRSLLAHQEWESKALRTVAQQLGVTLPPSPGETRALAARVPLPPLPPLSQEG